MTELPVPPVRLAARRLVRFVAVVVLVGATGCTSSGALRQGEGLEFISPPDGADVGLPVLLRWEPMPGEVGAYAVIVDRSPMPPGASIDWFGEADPEGVFVTHEPRLIIGRSAAAESNRTTRHEAIVVPLGGDGRRVGEHHGVVTFLAGGRS